MVKDIYTSYFHIIKVSINILFLCFGEKHLGLGLSVGLSVGRSVFKTGLAAGLPACMLTENFESKFVMAMCVVWWWCVFSYR